MLLLLSQGVIPKQDEVGQQDEKRLLGNIQTDIVTIDKPCPQFPNLQTPKPGDWGCPYNAVGHYPHANPHGSFNSRQGLLQ